MLVARRGLGVAEIRLLSPVFAAAVRWAVFAEQLSDDLPELRRAAANDPPDGLHGAGLVKFIATRGEVRDAVKQREAVLYPVDADGE